MLPFFCLLFPCAIFISLLIQGLISPAFSRTSLRCVCVCASVVLSSVCVCVCGFSSFLSYLSTLCLCHCERLWQGGREGPTASTSSAAAPRGSWDWAKRPLHLAGSGRQRQGGPFCPCSSNDANHERRHISASFFSDRKASCPGRSCRWFTRIVIIIMS